MHHTGIMFKGDLIVRQLITNIFGSEQLFPDGIPVTVYSITANLNEEKAEKIASWFNFKYGIPATSLRYNGEDCLAIATDEILPPEIDDTRGNVALSLRESYVRLRANISNEKKAVENLIYQSIDKHVSKLYRGKLWLRYRTSRTYCEQKPMVVDEETGVQVYSCFNIFSDYLADFSIGFIIDSTSTLVEKKTLLDHYKNMTESEFNSRYTHKWVLLTDERNVRRTKYFVGVKKGLDIDQSIISTFAYDDERISVRDRFHNINTITGGKLSDDDLIAEIKNYEEDEHVDYVPLSCIQHTPNLDEIKEDNEEIVFSENIYISPQEKYHKIQSALSYFQGIEFGKYKEKIILNFNDRPEKASGKIDLPILKFKGNTEVNQDKKLEKNDLKYLKVNSLRQFGYYKEPDLNKILIINRTQFDYTIVNRFGTELIKKLQEYSIPISDSEVEVISHLNGIEDLKTLIERTDDEILLGVIAIVNDRNFNYKAVKEILHGRFIPSQAIREDTLSSLRPGTGKYNGVLQNVVAGIVTKCDGIPWILSNKLSCNLFVGIDSGGPRNKKSWTSAYVFDEHGEKIHVRSPSFYAKEGIPKGDFKKLIIDAVDKKMKIDPLNSAIEGITIHRDGFLTKSERDGLESALNQLKLEDKVSNDINCLSVNVKKGANFRLFSIGEGGHVRNPNLGTYFLLDSTKAFISTTGEPLLTELTSKPLLVEVNCILGRFSIEDVVTDIFYLSELNWGSPTSPIKLPITTYYADKMLDFADYDSRPTYLPI